MINESRKARADAAGAAFPSPGFAKLEHADFLKKVPQVLGQEHAGNFSVMFLVTIGNGGARRSPGYRFPKREACPMAMGYSYELHMTQVERKNALAQVQKVVSQTSAEFLADLPDAYGRARKEKPVFAEKRAALVTLAQADLLASPAAKEALQ